MKLYPIILTLFILTAAVGIFLFVTDLKAEDTTNSTVKIIPNYRTDGTVSFQVLTVTNHGQYSTRNIGAIWISTESGTFVKTLKRWGNSYLQYLTKWHACTSSGNMTGAITSATLSNHITHTVTWNCKNTSGVEVPDGNYKIWVEFTESDAAGPWTSVTFTKGPSATHLTPTNATYFHNMVLDFTPTLTISAPQNLTANLVDNAQVNIAWSAPTSTYGLTGYKLYRNSELLNTFDNTTTVSYTDTPGEGNFGYHVTAMFGTVESAASNTVSVTVPSLTVPQNLNANVIGNTQVTLTWSAPANTIGLTSYLVYRDGATIATTNSSESFFTDTPPVGDHTYYITAMFGEVESAASNTVSVVITANSDWLITPNITALIGNYPNPFNPTTSISFSLDKNQYATLSVYNSKGQKVRELVKGNLNAGLHVVSWDGTDGIGHRAASGFYFSKLETTNKTLIKKMIMLK